MDINQIIVNIMVVFMVIGALDRCPCGTGTCASVAAAAEAGYVKKDEFVLVHLRGGDISVKYDSDGSLTMKGDAEFVFDGELYE